MKYVITMKYALSVPVSEIISNSENSREIEIGDYTIRDTLDSSEKSVYVHNHKICKYLHYDLSLKDGVICKNLNTTAWYPSMEAGVSAVVDYISRENYVRKD